MEAPSERVRKEPLFILLPHTSEAMNPYRLIFSLACAAVFLALAIRQSVRNVREPERVDFSARLLPWCLGGGLLVMLSDAASGGFSYPRMLFFLTLSVMPLMMLAFSLHPLGRSAVLGCVGMEIMAACSVLAVSVMGVEGLPDSVFLRITLLSAFLPSGLVLYSFWYYIRRIRNVVAKTTIWSMLSFGVDVVYALSLVILVCGSCLLCSLSDDLIPIATSVASLFIIGIIVALSYRISTDSLFFIMRRHENTILESMNDVPTKGSFDSMSQDEVYREIYERVVDYFDKEAPYLRGDLVIDDLSKEVFSNKLYISRAISRCTGRNFCQFVNYYRIRHSVEVFRRNPECRVSDLAGQCGFNSVVSFTMAFKLYMNENPSDWIRQERNRLSKKKTGKSI